MGGIAIFCAMDAEIDAMLGLAEKWSRTDWRGFCFHQSHFDGKPFILVKSGVGKVACAMVSQKLIDTFSPSALVFTGVAGALNPAYEIGDVVVSRDCLQHDIDGRALGFARGRLLYSEWSDFPADPALRALALGDPSPRVHEGRILTGDQFMTRDAINLHQYLVEDLAGDAVEMEGGALAQVAAVNGLPYVVIRTLSDKADGDAVHDFNRFLPVIAGNSRAAAARILAGYLPPVSSG